MNDGQMKFRGSHEAVLLEKDGKYAVIALSDTLCSRQVLGQTDRDGRVVQSLQTSPESAQKNFAGSIETSLANGWRIAYRDFPYGSKEKAS